LDIRNRFSSWLIFSKNQTAKTYLEQAFLGCVATAICA
jgi:hypothetical protein